MSKTKNHITVFEHDTLRCDVGELKISPGLLKSLQNHYGTGIPYYELCHNGVKFNQYVGVIQVGTTLIEVLPKADKNPVNVEEQDKWRKILIDLLRAVGSFEIKSTSHSNLKIKPNSLLDLYFELFIKEVEYLIHNGLVKKYRKKEGNTTALKGNLQFAKHLQQNFSHQERFFVKHTTYDLEHTLHFILVKTIRLLMQINTHISLVSRINSVNLFFQEMPEIRISEGTFQKLSFSRKTEVYRKAIEIARLLLLNYHPDLSKGQNHILALMFDMNKLWEKFVFTSLKKMNKPDITIKSQCSTDFWQPEYGSKTTIRPDIVIQTDAGKNIVLDTKWKNLNGINPSPEDLRQMFVYQEYFNANRVALIYPSHEASVINGSFFPTSINKEKENTCSVISLTMPEKPENGKSIVNLWQLKIAGTFSDWVNEISR